MQFRQLDLDGPVEIVPRKIEDERGYFSETFRLDEFAIEVSSVEFVQENQSLSVRTGTIRGIHFQSPPAAQHKLVRCLAGRVFDVSVGLRLDKGRVVTRDLAPVPSRRLGDCAWTSLSPRHCCSTLAISIL
jgi:dTDP-4-dehydrorhamnose 3,5-epimerase